MTRAYLGLGSNMGDKKNYIDQAIGLLGEHEAIEVTKQSSYYETDPVGYVNQDIFLNVVLEVETSLQPLQLLEYCNKIEAKLDRKRIIRWGPRTIDLDILIYEGYQSQDEELMIPHPRMTERAFVMVPLYELNQNLVINGKDIRSIMEGLQQEGIRRASV
ncbi:2-amino-4-hydroxy-6-hydroxymethyldihydropteridine diphosphokinase [Alkaliphilus hydrothermalis]|uniref:2-amino-4-hydroxy-6-hydroxymethyldihydropteridine diphosphokinase n=1 Tax=Alkaliphilus hydrothermalis TaxID=1482730 RepID=A0ABS2NPS2_9FIRM|nr:2-amino-4-hydroxy-6-hydroxymethyldihydropteridine diphosphokinase [Alkaliphilus hydrothermalis]MBM7614945.1 2-amino-4-hydroxy-6-hydroxymethyldihydropteridine diphosphokinase [Alkaliphilus hydrothermalis]